MRNEDLINKLKQFPMDMHVCIFDPKKNEEYASDEPSSEGVYKSIGIYLMHTEEELKEINEEYPSIENFIALEFNSEN